MGAPDARGEVTAELFVRLHRGDEGARAELLTRVYDELKLLAARQMAGERRAHTLQATALVHEAYARLSRGAKLEVVDRAELLRAAAQVMRQVLVDHARARGRQKRDGARVELEEGLWITEEPALDLLALEEALVDLERHEARLARLVEMRFFAAMEPEEIALLEGKSERTVRRDLQFARAWLRRRLESGSA
jgi:RNA polymerase sigma factor (TIGR02999 family)